MKNFKTIILILISFILLIPDISFSQYPLVTIEEIQYQHPDSLLLNGDRPSPYNGQTVKVRGIVMTRPLVDPMTDRRPVMWAGARWVTYLNDPTGLLFPNFDGLNVLQMDTSVQYQGTFYDHLDTAQVVEITLTLNEYQITTEGGILITPVTPVAIISQLPKRPDPMELQITDFVNGGVLNPLAEEYEGQYVIIRNVFTSHKNDSTGTFRINDGQGNFMVMYDQSGYFTKRGHRLTGLTTYEPPADSTTLRFIRGVIQTRTYGYFITPIYPGDIKEVQNFQLTVDIGNGWNMVSVPGLHPVDQNVDTWWPFRDMTANVFKYAGGYLSVNETLAGLGYWMKHAGNRTYNTGDEWPADGIQTVAHNPITAASGWNLIGGYENIVSTANLSTTPPGQISGQVYMSSGGYQVATSLVPGYGYWIKLLSDCQINIPNAFVKNVEAVDYVSRDWGRIIFTDATGRNYTLYAVKGEVDLSQYELPPLPPAGMFDIRYESGRLAEDLNSSVKTIDMSGITYPLTVRVEGMDIRLMDEGGRMLNESLKDGEEIIISDATIMKLMVIGELIPAVYSLEQNYPNPFNPSTVIKFSLPEDVSNVKLSIYNALGEKVTELVNSSLVAGKYSYTWNAQNVATGMYIYELRTDKFVAVKKMILMK